MRKCPVCEREFKHVKEHVKRNHPEEYEKLYGQPGNISTDKETENNQEKPEAENLELVTPEITKYRCVDCGYTGLTFGQSVCPKCSTQLDWSGING